MTAALSEGPRFAYDPVTLARERRPRMLASLLSSSALIPLLFLLAASLVRLLPRERLIEVPPPPPVFQPVPYAAPPPSRPPSPAPSVRIHSSAAGFPVPTTFEPPLEVEPTGSGAVGPTPGTLSSDRVVLGRATGEPDTPLNQPGQAVLADQLPTPIRTVKPAYPELGRDAHLEGMVVVFVLVGRDGRVLDARVDPERHVPLLDPAALAAARQWRFEPALSNGRPVAVWVSLPFRFVLHGGD